MRRKWKSILIALILLPILGAIVAFRIIESPSRMLRHALHLEQLPASVTSLSMGSDIWAGDEVRDFYLEIAHNDFSALLSGRQFDSFDYQWPVEARTIHVSPPRDFAAHWIYRWEAENARCEVKTNAEKTRVIVVFGAH